MENETGSEAAKPESNLRKVLSMKDILDGNISQDSESSAVTPYEGDAALTAAMLKYSDEERLNIANAVRKAVSSIDMPALHNYDGIITQLRKSTSAIKEITSSPYLNESHPFPARYFHSPAIFEPIENTFEPIPTKGIECFKFYATGGTAVQAGNVLSDELDPLKVPTCFLIPHNGSDCHWHIYIYDGDIPEAREWHIAGQDIEDYQEYLTYKGQDKVKRIGFVYVSDRPKMQIIFYVFDEAYKDLVKELGRKSANEVEKSGFDVFEDGAEENSLPAGATIVDDFDEVLFGTTTLELTSLVSAFLQVEGYVADSASVGQKYHNGQVCIQYPFTDCIIRLQTKSEKFLETNVKPNIHCWETNPIEREKKLTTAQQHVIDLLEALKHKIRWIPQKPKSLDDIGPWFEYLQECKKAGIKYTLVDLAKDISKSYGYVRQKHSEYLAGKES